MKKICLLLAAALLASMMMSCGAAAVSEDESAMPFTDVSADAYYADAVRWCWENGVMQGTAEDSFSPDEAVTRGQIVTILWRLAGSPAAEGIARQIAAETGADIYEIIPETLYTEEDLNYNNSSSRANLEQADASARPAISGGLESVEQYDVIFLGYPIWHGQAPRIISTFLESCDFSGVTIIPFCTSHSSGIGSSAENLHSLCSDAVWQEGRRFAANTSEAAVSEWVQSLELIY